MGPCCNIPMEDISGSKVQAYNGFQSTEVKNLFLLRRCEETLFAHNQASMENCEGRLSGGSTRAVNFFTTIQVKGCQVGTPCKSKVKILFRKSGPSQLLESSQVHYNLRLI